MDDSDGNENVIKAIGLLSKNTTLHVHHAFLYISLPSLHDYDVKMPNFTFFGGHKRLRIFLCLSKLVYSLQETNSRTFAYIWHFQKFGLTTKKIEKTRIHFNSDVFYAVVVVDAKTPLQSLQRSVERGLRPVLSRSL